MSVPPGERETPETNSTAEARARALLAAIVDSSDDAIISKDLNGIVSSWNAAATRLFGYEPEEMIGQPILKIMPPELHADEDEILRKVRSGQAIDHFETQRLRKDGSRVEVSLTISPIRDETGRIIGASKIARDISERKRAEEARMRLAAIVESSDDAIASKTLDGIITSWNVGATRMFGYEPQEMIGQSVLKLIPPELKYEEAEILRKLRAGETISHYETRRMRKDGTILDVSLSISPVRDARGRVIGASKIARDVSERKRAEAALIESEKLAAIGRMAAAIAHEVNNPLEAITNLGYLLLHHRSLDEEARGYARLLFEEVGRASRITKQSLAYYRDSSVPGPVNLPELLDSVLELQRPALTKKKIRVYRAYRTQSAIVEGFAAELRQVFANLVRNAIEAVGANGELRIRVDAMAGGGGKIRVTIADNGCGIPARSRARLFQPFFTTKGERGNGLGLWVSHGIIRKHRGHMRVHTSMTPGHSGSIFSVFLPRTAQEGVVSQAA